MARRSLSALAGRKPAQSMAICIACSWNSGTPRVRFRMFFELAARDRRSRLREPRGSSGTDAPCRPGSGPAARSPPRRRGRSTRCGLSRGSIDICARLSTWNTPTESALAQHARRPLGSSVGMPRPCCFAVMLLDQVEALAQRRQHAERQHVDLVDLERVEIVLVPFDDGAVLHRRVLDRHQLVEPVRRSARSRRHAARDGAGSRSASPTVRAPAPAADRWRRGRPRARA